MRNSVGGSASNGTGVGLRNAEARLKYLYSGDASLRLDVSERSAAQVVLSVPALSSKQHGGNIRPLHTAAEKENSTCAFSSSMTNH
jgi:hypothetical protein